MTITVTFDPPLPSDSPASFNTKAFTLLGDMNTWSAQANALPASVASDVSAILASPPSIGTTTPAAGSFTTLSANLLKFPGAVGGSITSKSQGDYEEGTWTPTQGAGLTVVGTFSSSGTYTKIGRVVTINGQLNGSTSVSAAANSVTCSGLPFTTSTVSIGSATNNNLSASAAVFVFSNNAYFTAMGANPLFSFTATYTV